MVEYNRKKMRLQGYDYASGGAYFITICTKNRKELFGTCNNSGIELTQAGKIAFACMKQISVHFNNTEVNDFVIMPNHVHAILSFVNVGNAHVRSLQIQNTGLSLVIQQYKAAVTKEIRRTNTLFFWQKSFYDHIIRNEDSYLRISEYMQNNPIQWAVDAENPGSGRDRKDYYDEITGYKEKAAV